MFSITGVVCAGNIVLDLLVRPVDRLVWNTTTWVTDVDQFVGGNGANTSYALARLGTPVRLIGYAGKDSFGDLVVDRLQEAGVGLEGLVRTEEPTALTVGLVRTGGDRLFLHRGGASRVAFPDPLAFSPSGEFSHFHLANLFGLPLLRQHAAAGLANAKQAGYTTSLDTGWDSQDRWMLDLAPCLPYTDLLFVNQSEAAHLTGEAGIAEAAEILLTLGTGAVIVKIGAEGCRIFSRDVASGHCDLAIPAFPVAAIDTTGAGDCFTGAFLASLARSPSLEQAGRMGNAGGALSTAQLGATTGLLDWEETLIWIARQANR